MLRPYLWCIFGLWRELQPNSASRMQKKTKESTSRCSLRKNPCLGAVLRTKPVGKIPVKAFQTAAVVVEKNLLSICPFWKTAGLSSEALSGLLLKNSQRCPTLSGRGRNSNYSPQEKVFNFGLSQHPCHLNRSLLPSIFPFYRLKIIPVVTAWKRDDKLSKKVA